MHRTGSLSLRPPQSFYRRAKHFESHVEEIHRKRQRRSRPIFASQKIHLLDHRVRTDGNRKGEEEKLLQSRQLPLLDRT